VQAVPLKSLIVRRWSLGAQRNIFQAKELRDLSHVSLSPQVFRKMLRLLEPTLTSRGEDYKEFLKNHDNELDLLPKFLEDLMTVPEDIIRLQVSSFRNPFREISWLFTRITGQESTSSISRMII
jgi:hypothetical protein